MAVQRQTPGGAYVNETTLKQYQLPGGAYLNQRISVVFPTDGLGFEDPSFVYSEAKIIWQTRGISPCYGQADGTMKSLRRGACAGTASGRSRCGSYGLNPSRIYFVDAEGRGFIIAAENRRFSVTNESRIFNIAAENRVRVVDAENRIFSAASENREFQL